MNKILLVLLMMISTNVQAETSVTISAASNYIWRGISFSSLGKEAALGSPVIQGSFDYAHSSGFAASIFVGGSETTNYDAGGIAERDSEFDPTLSYTHSISDDFKVFIAASAYLYVKNSSNNSIDYQLGIAWTNLRLDLSYMDNYFGTKSSDTYTRLSWRQSLNEKIGFFVAAGSTHLGNQDRVGFKDYMDYRTGLFYSSGNTLIEATFSGTNRQDLNGVEFNDKAATISASMTFK